ncbi:serine hydrolase domain-containing protein (plasmid) [Agrobacterium sp. rho-8.1]|nr:serine hydrolase domain-containing protein [Agrobacterium sp. rho-8.1]
MDEQDPVLGALASSFVNQQRQALGIVVGFVDSGGTKFASAGQFASDDNRQPDEETIFEIGSVTKVFTAFLLAALAEDGVVDLRAPIRSHLSPEIVQKVQNIAELTLADLATHRSGLPNMPRSLSPPTLIGPFAEYSLHDLHNDLKDGVRVGKRRLYSNFSYAVLTYVLESVTGLGYDQLLNQYFTRKLLLKSTTLDPIGLLGLIPGHTATFDPVPRWKFGLFVGSGGLYSTASDLAVVLRALLGLEAAAPSFMVSPSEKVSPLGVGARACWMFPSIHKNSVAWQAGKTGGYASFIGVDPTLKKGVVVLANTALRHGIDEFGRLLLDQRALHTTQNQHRHASIRNFAVSQLVGKYGSANLKIEVSVVAGVLNVRFNNLETVPIPEVSGFRFYLSSLQAELTFHIGDGGDCYAVTLHHDGKNFLLPATRAL